MTRTASAFWLNESGKGEVRQVTLAEPGPGEVEVRTLHSGVSRGTETLVFRGGVSENQHAVMRAPFQEGDFPWPVKYGYLNVGVVESGDLRGRTVFCLYPHQTRYVVPETAVTLVPEAVPASRAVLAGTVETAVNAVWDARPLIGDRIAVVGGGMVGSSIAAVLATFPGARVELVDADPAREAIARELGVGFALPGGALDGCDLVFHASATEQGLTTALNLLAPEGRVIELSWYGDRKISVPLGEFFHSKRLTIRSSQVGTVGRPDRTYAERMAVALDLLADDRFDALITGHSAFEELPDVMPKLADGEIPALCHRIDYGQAHVSQ
ncbi:dehydrogenase [Lentzea pudingi]|uniref:Dehydrogenase n=1 Tax=Lentzea pudingi TaxID=1789439 RepID=A0ABQ2IM56_9PSEU|nr:zinc-binding alcohol dehydrogenase [Lentzea pudingi]GGN16163.1 dehydrogenase [Lentzea pudingi]